MRNSLGRGKREIESQLWGGGGEQQVWVVEPGVGSEFNTVDCILNPVDRNAAEVFPGPRAGRNRQRKNVRLLSLVDLSNPPRFFEQVGGGHCSDRVSTR